jgi:hypothetical protein
MSVITFRREHRPQEDHGSSKVGVHSAAKSFARADCTALMGGYLDDGHIVSATSGGKRLERGDCHSTVRTGSES